MVYDLTKPQSSCTCDDATNLTTIAVDYTASDNHELTDVSLWANFDDGAWTDTGQVRTTPSGSFSITLSDGEGMKIAYRMIEELRGSHDCLPENYDTQVDSMLDAIEKTIPGKYLETQNETG